MFWFKPFRDFLRKFTIFRNFHQWSEILSMSDGRPSSQGVCPSLGVPEFLCCRMIWVPHRPKLPFLFENGENGFPPLCLSTPFTYSSPIHSLAGDRGWVAPNIRQHRSTIYTTQPPIGLNNDTLLGAIHEFSEGGGEESSLETELYKTILPNKRPYHIHKYCLLPMKFGKMDSGNIYLECSGQRRVFFLPEVTFI